MARPKMEPDIGIRAVFRGLRRGEAGVWTRLATSLICAQFLAAAALAGAWGFALLRSRSAGTYSHVRDEELAVAFALAGGLWLIALAWIWRDAGGGRLPVRAIIGTAGVAVFTVLAGIALDELLHRIEEEYLIGALVLAATAVVAMIWVPAIQRLRLGRPVVDAEDLVNVHCPECGYSLIGLRELRCPECGTNYTIDDLIRRQGYGDVDRQGSGNGARLGVERRVDREAVSASPDRRD